MMTGQPRPTGQPPQPGQPEQAKRPSAPEGAHGFQRWAPLLLAAALIGGLAGAALTRESVLWAVVFSLIVAAVALTALAGGLLDDDAEAPRRPPSKRRRLSQHSADQPATARPDPAASPPSRRDLPGPAAAAPAEIPGGAAPDADPVTPPERRLPGQPRPASGGQPWWEQPGAEPAAPSAATPPADDRVPRHARLAAAGYADFGDQAQIAQCPRCGSFRVDAGTQAAPPWHFACHECRHGWTWRPGIPWPSVQVRPNVRRPAEKPRW